MRTSSTSVVVELACQDLSRFVMRSNYIHPISYKLQVFRMYIIIPASYTYASVYCIPRRYERDLAIIEYVYNYSCS